MWTLEPNTPHFEIRPSTSPGWRLQGSSGWRARAEALTVTKSQVGAGAHPRCQGGAISGKDVRGFCHTWGAGQRLGVGGELWPYAPASRQGSWLRVQVQGLGFRGLGYRVWGSGLDWLGVFV